MTIKNSQFKHLNLCMNEVDDDILPHLQGCLKITGDEFGITLSSNKLSEGVIQSLHKMIT